MRIIKFRGKRIDNGEWVYGLYFTASYGKNICHFIQTGEYAYKNGSVYGCEVDPKTVGQLLFICQKEVEVYEDDVIEFMANYTSKPAGYMKAKIVMGTFKVELHSENGEVYDPEEETDEFPYSKCYVLGNIHDTIELLQ